MASILNISIAVRSLFVKAAPSHAFVLVSSSLVIRAGGKRVAKESNNCCRVMKKAVVLRHKRVQTDFRFKKDTFMFLRAT